MSAPETRPTGPNVQLSVLEFCLSAPDRARTNVYEDHSAVGEPLEPILIGSSSKATSALPLEIWINDQLWQQTTISVPAGNFQRTLLAWLPTAPGDYVMRAVLDPANAIKEVNESDNADSVLIHVAPPEAGIYAFQTLAGPSGAEVPVTSVIEGTPVRASATVFERGAVPDCDVLLEVDGHPVLQEKYWFASEHCAFLSVANFDAPWTASGIGTHILRFRIDPAHTSSDSDPTDNDREIALQVTAASVAAGDALGEGKHDRNSP